MRQRQTDAPPPAAALRCAGSGAPTRAAAPRLRAVPRRGVPSDCGEASTSARRITPCPALNPPSTPSPSPTHNHNHRAQYISEFMARLRQFAKANLCHVFLVAHPKQQAGWRGQAPSLMDISGGANFFAK